MWNMVGSTGTHSRDNIKNVCHISFGETPRLMASAYQDTESLIPVYGTSDIIMSNRMLNNIGMCIPPSPVSKWKALRKENPYRLIWKIIGHKVKGKDCGSKKYILGGSQMGFGVVALSWLQGLLLLAKMSQVNSSCPCLWFVFCMSNIRFCTSESLRYTAHFKHTLTHTTRIIYVLVFLFWQLCMYICIYSCG